MATAWTGKSLTKAPNPARRSFSMGLSSALILTLRGTPFLYYGEEIGMVGNGAHEYIRSPMQWTTGAGAGFTTGTPWQAINANYPLFNVATAQQDTQSLLAWYKRLVHARNGSPAISWRWRSRPWSTRSGPRWWSGPSRGCGPTCGCGQRRRAAASREHRDDASGRQYS